MVINLPYFPQLGFRIRKCNSLKGPGRALGGDNTWLVQTNNVKMVLKCFRNDNLLETADPCSTTILTFLELHDYPQQALRALTALSLSLLVWLLKHTLDHCAHRTPVFSVLQGARVPFHSWVPEAFQLAAADGRGAGRGAAADDASARPAATGVHWSGTGIVVAMAQAGKSPNL